MADVLIVPPINSFGTLNLKDPYASQITATTPYKVAAIRTLTDIAASGQDPYELYYEPLAVSQADYANDLARGVVILSLVSPSGQWVFVPNSFLNTAPIATGLPYYSMIVGVNLGMLPSSFGLSYFMNAVKELAHDLIGVNDAPVVSSIVSDALMVSIEDSATIEAARKAIMATVITDRAKLQASELARQKAEAKIVELENFIISLNLPDTPAPAPTPTPTPTPTPDPVDPP